MEQARGAWCRDRGFNYKDLEEMGYGLPLVESWVKYKSEAEYDEVITVEIRLESVKRTFLVFSYRILDESGRLLTEAWTKHALMNSERRAVTVPESIMQMLTRPSAAESNPET